jgi:hypothetical protein
MTTDGYPKIAGCGNATAVEKRRAIFLWIVAFTNGPETGQSDLAYHSE